MTGDEEDAGEPLSLAREALVSAAKGAAIAIGFEDGPADPKLAVTARRGTTGWEVKVTGKPAHSSQIFRDDIGYGAVYEAGAHRQRLPRKDGRRGAPHLQSRRDARRHDGRVRSGATPRHGVRQDQRHRRARGRLGRSARPVERAVREGEEDDARDRRPDRCRTRRRRSGSTRAIRRWRRRKGTRGCWRCTTRPAAISGLAR